ncbi:MAG: SPOR domain-containing protein [Burkholderiales bacterium]
MTAPPAEANLDDLRRRARRRLVGAIVLALAAAVFVPMLLESEPRPLGEDVSVRIPPVDDSKFVNRLSDKGRGDAKAAGAKGDAKQEGAKADAAKKDLPKSEPPKAEPEAAAKTEAPKQDTTPVPASAAEPPPAAAPKRSLEEAEQRVLAAPAKAPAASAPAPAPAPAATPVPAPAAKAPPAEAAPAPAPAAPAKADGNGAGFSVQLAAFSDDKGANALANRLKKGGYAAYTEPLETSRGTLWRVRVGPFPSREAAVAVRDKLKGEGHSGIVAPVK